MFFKELVEKTEKLTNYNSYGEIFMTQSILLKWNEISFSLKVFHLAHSLHFTNGFLWNPAQLFGFTARNESTNYLFVSSG